MKLGICYYPEHTAASNWEDDARSMRNLGIYYVRMGEFCWSRVEPKKYRFTFEWLDNIIHILGENGLKVVMCTPTATPPKWLVDEHPSILAADVNGKPRKFGSRRHYSFSSDVYRQETKRIVEIFAKRYGENPNIVGWQTDNEYGCHDTTLCYSSGALKNFRLWLSKKYKRIDNLNLAWGTVFWSAEYTDFSQIELPNLTVTEANPAHRLDFYRFSSEQVVSYNRLQTEILRKFSPDRWITHNSMGMFFDYDHYELSKDLDFVSWDNYPLGMLATFDFCTSTDKQTYLRTGHPDISPFMHDLYCGQSNERKFWIMEQQPGPVNWAPYNPVPENGMVRQWLLQGFAHGAETVSCFRWRQCEFAQEQEHAGLKFSDNTFTGYSDEVAAVAEDIAKIEQHLRKKKIPSVGLVFDYESIQRILIQPQGKDFDPIKLYFNFYSAIRGLGLNVEIIPVSAPLDAYDLLLIPCLPYGTQEFAEKIKRHKGTVVLGPRCFSKTVDFQNPKIPVPAHLTEVFENQMSFADSFPASFKETIHSTQSQKTWQYSIWRENFRQQTEADYKFSDGAPACLRKGNMTYLAFYPEIDFLTHFFNENLPRSLKDRAIVLPPGIRRTYSDNLIYYFNTAANDFTVPLKKSQEILIGESVLKRNQVTVLLDS